MIERSLLVGIWTYEKHLLIGCGRMIWVLNEDGTAEIFGIATISGSSKSSNQQMFWALSRNKLAINDRPLSAEHPGQSWVVESVKCECMTIRINGDIQRWQRHFGTVQQALAIGNGSLKNLVN